MARHEHVAYCFPASVEFAPRTGRLVSCIHREPPSSWRPIAEDVLQAAEAEDAALNEKMRTHGLSGATDDEMRQSAAINERVCGARDVVRWVAEPPLPTPRPPGERYVVCDYESAAGCL